MQLFRSIKGMIKSFFSSYPGFYGIPYSQTNGVSSVFSSVWLIAGIEDISQTLASLPLLFVDANENEIERPSVEQKEWMYVLNNPDYFVQGRQLWELTTMLYETDGLAYWVLYNEEGRPIENPLEVPARILAFGKSSINPQYDTYNPTRIIGWTLNDGYSSIQLRQHQVVRFWKTNPKSYREGLSLMDKVGLTTNLDNSAKRVNASYFNNGARPSGTIQQTERVDPDEAQKFAVDFRLAYSSPDNAGKIPLIPKEYKFEPLDNVKDMDFVNLHKNNRDEFFASHRVPKFHLGVNDDLNYATAEISDRAYYQNKIQPICAIFEDVINNRLLLGTGMKVQFSFENIPSIQVEKLKVEEQDIKNDREKWRIASYMWRMGYSVNQINEYLNMNAPVISQKWANEPHNPLEIATSSDVPQKTRESNTKEISNETNDVKLFDIDRLLDKVVVKKKTIYEAIRDNDIEAMDEFCKSVESSSIGSVIPKYEKVINSYFDRLESSQIKRIEAFLDGESYINKAIDDNEITKENVESVLFSKAKWNGVLVTDTQMLYVTAYTNSVSVIEQELGGFVNFSATDSFVTERARKLQLNVVGINDRLRNNIRNSIVNVIEAGGQRTDIIDAVKNVFNTSHARASTIARTESGIAMNGARYDALSADVEKKQWVSAKDNLVRDSHRTFSSLGSKDMNYEYASGLKYPQDSNSSDASEVVNCRCVLVKGL